MNTQAFHLHDHPAKAGPALIAADEEHFAAIACSLQDTVADLEGRLDAERRTPVAGAQAAMDRDLEVHRLTARRRTLRRFSLDLCLGRIVAADDPEPVYIGRLGLTDRYVAMTRATQQLVVLTTNLQPMVAYSRTMT